MSQEQEIKHNTSANVGLDNIEIARPQEEKQETKVMNVELSQATSPKVNTSVNTSNEILSLISIKTKNTKEKFDFNYFKTGSDKSIGARIVVFLANILKYLERIVIGALQRRREQEHMIQQNNLQMQKKNKKKSDEELDAEFFSISSKFKSKFNK